MDRSVQITTVGYGDYAPGSQAGRMVVSWFILIACGAFAAILGGVVASYISVITPCCSQPVKYCWSQSINTRACCSLLQPHSTDNVSSPPFLCCLSLLAASHSLLSLSSSRHTLTITRSQTLPITCTYDEIKRTQDQDLFSYSSSPLPHCSLLLHSLPSHLCV